MKKLTTTLLASAFMAAVSGQAMANDLQPSHQFTTFGANETASLFEPGLGQGSQLAALSAQEMKATEGAIAPLVAVGIIHGGRFLAQRWVTQRVAQSMIRSAAGNASRNIPKQTWGVMANSRQQARAIVGRNNIREFHPGAGNRYTHYHPSPRNGGHVWYGRPR